MTIEVVQFDKSGDIESFLGNPKGDKYGGDGVELQFRNCHGWDQDYSNITESLRKLVKFINTNPGFVTKIHCIGFHNKTLGTMIGKAILKIHDAVQQNMELETDLPGVIGKFKLVKHLGVDNPLNPTPEDSLFRQKIRPLLALGRSLLPLATAAHHLKYVLIFSLVASTIFICCVADGLFGYLRVSDLPFLAACLLSLIMFNFALYITRNYMVKDYVKVFGPKYSELGLGNFEDEVTIVLRMHLYGKLCELVSLCSRLSNKITIKFSDFMRLDRASLEALSGADLRGSYPNIFQLEGSSQYKDDDKESFFGRTYICMDNYNGLTTWSELEYVASNGLLNYNY